MNYNTPRPTNQGDAKLSEVAVDTAVPLLTGSAPQSNALTNTTAQWQAILEGARRHNIMLRSDGISQFIWDGTNLRFDYNSVANTIDLEFLATESASYPSFMVQLVGSTSGNGAQTFQFLPVADGDVVYLELDSTQLAGQAGSPFALYNAINGGGLHVGLRVLVQPISAGMPQLQIGTTGSGSLFYFPLVMRRGGNLMWPINGQVWTPGTTATIGQAAPASTIPSGAIFPFASNTIPPSGWFLCNGQAISRTTYANLFAAIGTTYGAGDGSTTFNVPNLQGLFLRGVGSQTVGGITYTSGSLGAATSDEFQGHQHVGAWNNGAAPFGDWTTPVSCLNGVSITSQIPPLVSNAVAGSNGTPRYGSETRPVNMAVNYIISV